MTDSCQMSQEAILVIFGSADCPETVRTLRRACKAFNECFLSNRQQILDVQVGRVLDLLYQYDQTLRTSHPQQLRQSWGVPDSGYAKYLMTRLDERHAGLSIADKGDTRFWRGVAELHKYFPDAIVLAKGARVLLDPVKNKVWFEEQDAWLRKASLGGFLEYRRLMGEHESGEKLASLLFKKDVLDESMLGLLAVLRKYDWPKFKKSGLKEVAAWCDRHLEEMGEPEKKRMALNFARMQKWIVVKPEPFERKPTWFGGDDEKIVDADDKDMVVVNEQDDLAMIDV